MTAPRLRPVFVCLAQLIAGFTAAAAQEQDAIAKVHREIWRRFVDEHNVMLDYARLDGSLIRPTPEDCLERKPNAAGWGTPIEDGSMFNGLYVDALCSRWRLTHSEADRAEAGRLVDGLMFLATRGVTPGFIARGVATDGKTVYPMGSNDQTFPWLYGIWRYVNDGLASPDERARLVAKFTEVVLAIEADGWRLPCDGPPAPFRNAFTGYEWQTAPRLLFVMKAMHQFTGNNRWDQLYLETAQSRGGKSQHSMLEICGTGMTFDPSRAEARYSWTSSPGVAALRGLWEMEAEPTLRAVFAHGLRASAELAAQSLPLCDQFDPNGTEYFEHDWRTINTAWKPQHDEADVLAVHYEEKKRQLLGSPRLVQEMAYVREPLFAAWIVTLCPDRDFVEQQRPAILHVIGHYRYDRLFLSQFFPAESAWYRLP